MIKAAILAALALVALTPAALAKSHHDHRRGGLHPECNVTMPCAVSGNFLSGIRSIRIEMRRDRPRRGWPHTSGLVAPLAVKVAEISAACGSTMTPRGGIRHTHVRGTGRMSLHSVGKAADMQGNPSCIYAQLQGWPGGYSTDYGRVRHVHISYDAEGGREWGLRFAHRGKHRHARRYASR